MRKSFEEFVREQDKIYDKFRRLSHVAKRQGTMPDSHMNSEGYAITLVHPNDINEMVFSHSRRIAEYAPAVVQPAKTLHTTLWVNNSLPYDQKISDRLCDAVMKVDSSVPIGIWYTSWLFNQTTVIVAGQPNEPFVHIANQIQKQVSEDIKAEFPWGGHITTARFLERKGPEELEDFFGMMRYAPLIGLSRPTHIKVGYQRLTPSAFTYDAIEKFPLGA